MIDQADYLFKVVIIGDSAVGKSSLLKRYADDEFKQTYHATIGVDFKFKSVKVDDKLIKLQIWDTAGQERFRTITSAYYKNAHGIIIVFDLLNHKSFEDVAEFWFGEVEKYAEENAEVMVFGNKADMEQRAVGKEQAELFAKEKKVEYAEVSAKTGAEVGDAFGKLVQRLLKNTPPSEKKSSHDYKISVLDSIKKKRMDVKVRGGTTAESKKCQC